MVFSEKQIWQIVLERLSNVKDIQDTQMVWLRQSALVATHNPDLFYLYVPNAAIQRQLEMRCRPYIEHAMIDAIGGKRFPQLQIVTKEKEKRSATRTNAAFQDADPLFADAAPTPESLVASPAATMMHEKTVVNDKAARNARPTIDQRRRRRDVQMRQNAAPPRPPEVAVPPSGPRPPVIIHPPIRADLGDAAEQATWLNDRYTFDTFIVGKANYFTWAACRAVADAPGTAYNPLFIYGGVGLGKTHLLHAIAHAVAPRGLRTLYVTSETFTNEIINAIRYRTTEEFRAKYRSVDLLLVDDIQFIAGKDSTEEEFFHTFNVLHESEKQIVICSDRPPKAIDLEERLRSRFEWGLIADIQPPDFETRLAILSAKAEVMGIEIPPDCLDYLADRIQSNVRELEGLLNRVISFTKVYRSPLTIDLIKQALLTLAPDDKPERRISLIEIAALVAEQYHVTIEALKGKHRDKHIVIPRHVAMWIMRRDTKESLAEIGHFFGGRDHTTVINGCERIDAEMQSENAVLIREIEAIRQRLAEQIV